MALNLPKHVIVATHDRGFHADDVCAGSIVSMALLSAGHTFEFVRTRDKEKLQGADIVFDVGLLHDPEKFLFDHHQKEGAGLHDHGVPFAAFGLVWQAFGKDLAKSAHVFSEFERIFVLPVDAQDNGFEIYSNTFEGVSPLGLTQAIARFLPIEGKGETYDVQYKKAVVWTRELFERGVQHISADYEIIRRIEKELEGQSGDIVFFETPFPRMHLQIALAKADHVDPVYCVSRREKEIDSDWRILSVRKSAHEFASKKNLPESWRGLTGEELEVATGVSGGLFCHRSGFMATAASKEAAISLAKLAIVA